MTLVSKVRALLVAVTPAEFAGMSPVERRRAADLLRHVADMAEPRIEPKAGVLHDLGRGIRAE